MSSLFKSIYKRFSASQVDEAGLDKYALKLDSRKDLNNDEIWSQLESLEQLQTISTSILSDALKGVELASLEAKTYINQYLEEFKDVNNHVQFDWLEQKVESLAIESIFQDINIADEHLFGCDGYLFEPTPVEYIDYEGLCPISGMDILAEIKEKREELQEAFERIRIYLISNSQFRYLRRVLSTKTFSFYSVKSVFGIPLVYSLREYRDIVGSLKKVDCFLIQKNELENNNYFINIQTNEFKNNNIHTLFLN